MARNENGKTVSVNSDESDNHRSHHSNCQQDTKTGNDHILHAGDIDTGQHINSKFQPIERINRNGNIHTGSQRAEEIKDCQGECPRTKNIQECDSLIGGPGNNDPTDLHLRSDKTRSYSRLKVRILIPVISALYFTRGNIKTIIFQYLLDRWSLEAGHNSSVSVGHNACDRNESDPAFKEENAIQSRVADASVYFSWCSSFPSFATCLIVAALVDLVGRKTGLIIAQVGSASQLVLVIVIIRFQLHTDFLYLAYTLDGIGGGFMIYLISTLSMTADISDDKKSRIVWTIVVLISTSPFSAAVDVGIGYIINNAGYMYAAMSLLAPCSIALFLTVFVLPETLPLQGEKFSLKKLISHSTRILFLYTREGSKSTRWSLFLSLMIFFTVMLNKLSLSNTDTLYQKHEPLCWGSVDIGYYRAFKTGLHGASGLVFLGISRCIGCASDEVNSMVGLVFLAGSYVMEAFVKNYWEMYMVPVIAIPSVNIDSVTRAVMSYLAGPENQGVLFSSIALIEELCDLLSGTLYSNLYALTVDYMPGTVYLVMAGMSVVSFLLYIPFFHFYERPQRTYKEL